MRNYAWFGKVLAHYPVEKMVWSETWRNQKSEQREKS
jgi:hypothetical protein